RSLIVSLVQTLRDATPATIVIIGPDHQNAGSSSTTTTTSDWASHGVRHRMNRNITDALISSADVRASDAVIRSEHSVLIPMAFLAEQFPRAQFVLLALRSGFDQSVIHTLAEQLNTLLDPDDLVIASVDFSHYQTLGEAEKEDAVSLRILESGNIEAINNIAADSPASLAVAMRFAQLRDAGHLRIIQHANSATILGNPSLASTTSYMTGVFHK
ncbi:MAG: AmmeMemoRadiSam system protein B, partial [bacterium]